MGTSNKKFLIRDNESLIEYSYLTSIGHEYDKVFDINEADIVVNVYDDDVFYDKHIIINSPMYNQKVLDIAVHKNVVTSRFPIGDLFIEEYVETNLDQHLQVQGRTAGVITPMSIKDLIINKVQGKYVIELLPSVFLQTKTAKVTNICGLLKSLDK